MNLKQAYIESFEMAEPEFSTAIIQLLRNGWESPSEMKRRVMNDNDLSFIVKLLTMLYINCKKSVYDSNQTLGEI